MSKCNLRVYLALLLGLSLHLSRAQTRDSIPDDVNNLEEVVVSGQFSPQSVDQSVFEVKVITQKEIAARGGNNLADILNQTLNITIMPNASTGKSGVQLFGLDAQYFKILVDNIPLINDEGMGNNTDLTQINLDDIERVEIVEGAMGVQYGANAVSGIINIITKKSARSKWEITPYVQEESIGSEYNWVDEGRHIQSVKIGHKFSDKLYANGIVTRNNFNGYWGNRKGESYVSNDGLRGYEWLPKEQYTIKSLWNYTGEKYKLFYKFEYFDETINRYAAEVRENYNPATETSQPVASDEEFSSERIFNHLNVNGTLLKAVNYDVSVSYQQQKRNVQTYNYRIRTGEKFDVASFEYESRKAWYSKGNFSNFLPSKKSDLQIGYEVTSINGYASAISGLYASENIERTLGSYDVFASSEMMFSDVFSIRPGVRALFSSNFNPQVALSLSTKYVLKSGIEIRGIVGTSPRLPSYEELYTKLVDVNHNVTGNPNLNPEQGRSAFLHVKKKYQLNDWFMSSKLSGWYMNVKDRIELIIVNQSPREDQFTNIDTYKAWGVTYTHGAMLNNFRVNAGATFSGASKVVAQEENYSDDYLYALQLNASTSYTLPKWNTTFSAYLKYTGPQYQYVQKTDDAGEAIIVKGKQSDFTWLDATVKKSFYDDRLQVTLGARNLLDITSVQTTAVEGGAHSAAPSTLLLGYGRSYFLKLLYKLNF